MHNFLDFEKPIAELEGKIEELRHLSDDNINIAEEVGKLLGLVEKDTEKPKLKIEFSAGDSVKIKEGPFENYDGVIDEVDTKKGAVKVIITVFNRPTSVELGYWQVEAI